MLPLSHRRLCAFSLLALASATLFVSVGCNRDPNVRKQKYLESGNRYEKQGKFREAGIQFANALKLDHNFAEAHYALGKTYLRLGSQQAAYNELSAAVDLAPTNVAARLDLGNLALAGGAADKAELQAKAILAGDPNNADALALMAGVDGQKNDTDAALRSIRRAIQINPNRATYHTTLGVFLSHNPATAAESVEELRKAVSLDNTDTSSHMILASLYEKQNNYPAAISEVQAAIKIDPKALQSRVNLAGLYLRSGNTAETEHTLHQATEDFSADPDGANLLSDYYLAHGQLAQAESTYGYLVVKDPKSNELKLVYAKILVLLHRDDRAAKLAAELTKSAPNNPGVAILNSSLLLNKGKRSEALDTMQKAVNSAPGNAALLVALGKVAQQTNDLNKALTSFQEAFRIAPDNLDAASGVADVALRKQDYSLLTQVSDKVIGRTPNFAPAYVWRATAEANQKQFDNAERDFQNALKNDQNDANALIGLAQLRVLQKKMPEATALLNKALQANPRSVQALTALVTLDLQTNQPKVALNRINTAIQQSPGNPAMLDLLASVDLSLKDYAGARDAEGQSLQIEPNNESAVQTQAQAEMAMGHADAAVAAWQGWISKHPTDGNAMTMAGQIYQQKNETASALQLYRKAIQIDPGNALASNNLAYMLADSNQSLDEALSLAKVARSTLPNISGTADTLGWVFYRRGSYSLARQQFEDAVKIDPNDAGVQYHLGLTLAKSGDKAGAIAHLKKAIALANGSPIAKDATEALAGVR